MAATAETTKIYRVIIDSSKAVDGSSAATRALANIDKAAASMETTLGKLDKGLASVGNYLKANLALLAAEFGSRMLQMGKDALKAAADLDELAEQLGVTAKYLQGAQFAAVQSGVKMEQLETGFSKFSQKMGEAADGSKDMVEALDRIGVKNLDLQGKLRPTEDLMQDVAVAVMKIEDPARRSAAAVDFFGKTGTRMLPLLADLAAGADAMAAKAAYAGAMISEHTTKRLDELADSSARTGLKMRAFFANTTVDLLDWVESHKTAAVAIANAFTFGLAGMIVAWLQNLDKIGPALDAATTKMGDWIDAGRQGLDDLLIAGSRFVGGFIGLFRGLPEQLGRLFVDAMNAAIAGMETGLNLLSAKIAEKAPWLGVSGAAVSFGRLGGGGNNLLGNAASGAAAGAAEEEARMRAMLGNRNYAGERAVARDQAVISSLVSGSYDPTKPGTTGAGLSGIKGAGEDVRKRIDKLDLDTQRQVDEANALAAASERGAKAVADLDLHYKALKAAQDAYGDAAKANSAAVEALTGKIEAQMRVIERGKNLKEFNLETEQLEKANEILSAENRLINASVESRAREIALIKLKHEIMSRGLDENDPKEKAAIDRRRAALEIGEREKIQAEELRKAQELWTAPLKQALQNIQTSAADAFEKMLESGKVSFESLGQIFAKTVRRMAAEFLALATIRPVMGVVVQALGGIGLIGGSTASALGFPMGGGGGASLQQGTTGIGGMLGGGGGWLGSIGNWLGSPIGGFGGPIMAGAGPASAAMPVGVSGLSLPGLGGLSWGGALAGIGSIGMGVYGLMSGNGSTGSTLSGIAGILGGGVSLLGPMLGLGAAAGPIGLGIGLVGSILGALFGGGGNETPIPRQPDLVLGVGTFSPNRRGGFGSSGYGIGGATGLGKEAGALGTAVSRLFREGGLTATDQLIGGRVWSGIDHQLQGRQWADRPYTNTALVLPGDIQELITNNDSGRNLQQASDLLVAKVFAANVMRGGVSGASETLKAGLKGYDPQTADETEKVVQLSMAYDRLGKAANPVKDALDKLVASLDDLRDFAEKAGVSMDPIEQELKNKTKRTAQDFIDSMLDPLQVQLRALDDERKSALESAQYIKDHVEGVYVDLDKVVSYYTDKQADTLNRFYGGAVDSLKQAIDAVTSGPLSHLSRSAQFDAIGLSYQADLAKARALDPAALSRIASEGTNYLQAGEQMFASGPQYEALRRQILADYLEIQALIQPGGAKGGTPGAVTAQQQVTNDQIQKLADLVQRLSEDNADLQRKLTQTNDLLQRQVTNA